MNLDTRVHKSGFTLIELIFVIVIIGILASIAVPKLKQARKEAMVGQHKATQFESGTKSDGIGSSSWDK